MAVNLSFIGGAGWQFFTDGGAPLSGGKIYTYAAGSTTPLTTYTSRAGDIPNTNPIILDAAGRTPQQVWSTEGLLYKYVVADANDALIRTWDNIGGTVIAADLSLDLASTSDNNKGDALVGFRQSNASGFLAGTVGRTVSTKLQEFVSALDFGAVGNGLNDDTTAIRAAVTASRAVFFPAGYTFRITAEIVVPDNTVLFGEGSIFVDQTTYVRAFRINGNSTVRGLTFRGTGAPTAVSTGLLGGQRGVAISSFNTNNVKILNCKFYGFVSTGFNVGADIVEFGTGYAYEISQCYFDTTNEGFGDISASYSSGNVIIDKNISYSNSDYFYYASSVGSNVLIPGTDVSTTAFHIVTDNIAIKNRWGSSSFGFETGRHGIGVHYDGGISNLVATGNVIGNCSRHGIYARGPSLDVTRSAGPNIISNNFFAHCGTGEISNYCSSIRVETTLPTIISNNYMENAGYLPSGVAGSSPAYDIECVRGAQDIIVANNTSINAKDGGIRISISVSGRTMDNIKITGNIIKNRAFGIGLVWLADSVVADIEVLNNHITLTGAAGTGSSAAGIFNEGSATSLTALYSLSVMGNTIVGLGKTFNQYGIAMMFGTEPLAATSLIKNNTFRNLQYGLASRRFASGSFNYVPHRVLGTRVQWLQNRFVSCGEALVVPRNSTAFLAVVGPDNIYEDCTAGLPSATIAGGPVQGVSTGRDTSGNMLVEFTATAIPSAQQYYVGDRITDGAPTAGGRIGWVCTTAGAPGTWKTYGAIAA